MGHVCTSLIEMKCRNTRSCPLNQVHSTNCNLNWPACQSCLAVEVASSSLTFDVEYSRSRSPHVTLPSPPQPLPYAYVPRLSMTSHNKQLGHGSVTRCGSVVRLRTDLRLLTCLFIYKWGPNKSALARGSALSVSVAAEFLILKCKVKNARLRQT